MGKKVTISFKIDMEDFQDYNENLKELNLTPSEDLRAYVLGFNRSFGVDVQIKRADEHIAYYQKQKKQYEIIRKKHLDAMTNMAFTEIKALVKPYNVTEGEIQLPGRAILKDLAKIAARTHLDMPTLVDMLESNINDFKDEEIREEMLTDINNIREENGFQKGVLA